MNTLPSPVVIENVLQGKLRGKVAYQGFFPAMVGVGVLYVKPYNHQQRDARCLDSNTGGLYRE